MGLHIYWWLAFLVLFVAFFVCAAVYLFRSEQKKHAAEEAKERVPDKKMEHPEK